MLRRVFGSRENDMIEEWVKLHIEKLDGIYPSSGIVLTESRRMRNEKHD